MMRDLPPDRPGQPPAGPGEHYEQALRDILRRTRAPEMLRARITAMLGVERRFAV